MRKRRTNNSYRQEKDWSNSQPQKTRSRPAMKKEEGAPKASKQATQLFRNDDETKDEMEVAMAHTKLADTMTINEHFHEALTSASFQLLFSTRRASLGILDQSDGTVRSVPLDKGHG
ncbi:hypothetical protein NL676_023753 [Syzygium grande]|nr:hypothetical protein NL676_023753 [Syzygium grande]